MTMNSSVCPHLACPRQLTLRLTLLTFEGMEREERRRKDQHVSDPSPSA